MSWWLTRPVPTELAGPPSSSSTSAASVAAAVAPTTSVPAPTTTAPTTTTVAASSDTTQPDLPTGGTVRVGIVGERGSLHPLGERTAFGEAVGRLTDARAVWVDGTSFGFVPGVLAELPSVTNGGFVERSDGSVEVTLRIDPDARWEDGTPVTGADLAFTTSVLAGDRRVASAVRDLYRQIDLDSALVGPSTFRFVLSAATIDVWRLFEVIAPAHLLRDGDLHEGHWPSAGPFKVEVEAEDRVVLVPNPGWVGSGPLVNRVELIAYPDIEALAEAAATGLVHIAHVVDGGAADRLAADTGGSVVARPGAEWEHLGFSLGEERFVANPRSLNESATYRRLVADLLPSEVVVLALQGTHVMATRSMVGSSWPSAAWEPAEGVPVVEVDVTADWSRRIGDELGVTLEEAPTVRFATTNSLERTQAVGLILQQLAATGLAVDVSLDDPGLFFRDRVIPGEFDLAEWAWTVDPGPLGAVSDVQERFGTPPSDGEFNFYRWGQPGSAATAEGTDDLFELIGALDDLMDLDQLAAALRRIDRVVLSDGIIVPLWQTLDHAVVAPSLDGYRHPRAGVPITWQAEEWALRP